MEGSSTEEKDELLIECVWATEAMSDTSTHSLRPCHANQFFPSSKGGQGLGQGTATQMLLVLLMTFLSCQH